MCIKEADKTIIASSCKWARFIAILYLILMGLGALTCLIMLIVAAAGKLDSHYAGFSIIILLSMLIGFFPTLYLYRYASRGLKAVDKQDGASMTESFLYLKRYFEFTGVLTIVIFAFYLIFFSIGIPLGLFD